MILNRSFYTKVSFLKSLWNSRQMRKLLGEKIFKVLKLQKVTFPDKMYIYSPRLKKIPYFTGDVKKLALWQESKICETLCPTQAIKVTANAFIIDDRGCIACGLCLEVAPKGILRVSDEDYNPTNLSV